MPTDAQKRARNNWDAENMSIVSCKVKREVAEAFKEAARANGTTPNALIRECISEYIKLHQPQ